MIGFLNSLFNLVSVIMRVFEKYKTNKQSQFEIEKHKKAKAYENLQKAIKARMAARKSVAIDDILSDDGYRRD